MQVIVEVLVRTLCAVVGWTAVTAAMLVTAPYLESGDLARAAALLLPAAILLLGTFAALTGVGDQHWIASLGAGGLMFSTLIVFGFNGRDLRGDSPFYGREPLEIALLLAATAGLILALTVEAFLADVKRRPRGVAESEGLNPSSPPVIPVAEIDGRRPTASLARGSLEGVSVVNGESVGP